MEACFPVPIYQPSGLSLVLQPPMEVSSCGRVTAQAKPKVDKRKVYNLTSLLSREPSLLTPRALVRHSLLLLLLLMAAKLLVKKTLSSGKERGEKKNLEVALHYIQSCFCHITTSEICWET